MMDSKDPVALADVESAVRSMLTKLLKPLVDSPERCSVEVTHLDGSALFTAWIAPEDMDKFVGQNFRTARSLQIILSAVGAKSQQRFSLTFQVDTEMGKCRANPPPEPTGA